MATNPVVTVAPETTPTKYAPTNAGSTYGDLEMTKYLYESGLQNIFNTYQQNISKLNSQQQQQVQDAYYVRELSKKYLGEYASNVGVGDVSGNLIDVYSDYQKNISSIKENYGNLSFNLQQQYQSERFNTLSNIMKTQYQIDVAKKDEVFNKVLSEITYGDKEDKYSYLDSMKSQLNSDDYLTLFNTLKEEDRLNEVKTANKELTNLMFSQEITADSYNKLEGLRDVVGEEAYISARQNLVSKQTEDIVYNMLYGTEGEEPLAYLDSIKSQVGDDVYDALYSQFYDDFKTGLIGRIDSGMYGLDAEGKPLGSPLDTIEKYKDILTPKDYETMKATYAEQEARTEEYYSAFDYKNITSQELSAGVANPDYIGEDYDFAINTRFDEGINASSEGFKDSAGNKYFVAISSVDSEKLNVTGQELFDEYSIKAESDDALTDTPQNGYMMDYAVTDENGQTSTKTFVYKNGTWYRTVKENPITNDEMKLWVMGSDNSKELTDGVYLKDNWIGNDTFTINGVDFVAKALGKKYDINFYNEMTPEISDAVAKFKEVHGNSIPNKSVVAQNGKLYYYIDGKIQELVKK